MRTPRVLARIPRLASSPLSATSVPSTSVPLPVGDAADQVLLVEEPSVEAELELTLTTVAAQSGASTDSPTDGNAYFVDDAHRAAHSRHEPAIEASPLRSSAETSSQQTSRPKGSRRKRKRRPQSAPKSFSRSTAGGGWATNLSQLHAVLVPYSSLIVALALVASASLIYWLALGPVEATTDYREILSASTSAWPSAASESSSDPVEEPTFQESLWSTVYPQPEVDLPAAGFAPESVAQVAEFGTAAQSTIAQATTPQPTTQPMTSSPRFSLVDSQEPTASDLGMDGFATPEESKEDFLSPLMPTADFAPLDFSRLEQLYWVYPEEGPNRTEQSSSAVADRSLNAPTMRRR